MQMNDTPVGWIPDLGLDPESVTSMTPDEAKEYLTLVIRYFDTTALPSLAWLRRATAASQKSDPHSKSQRGDSLMPSESEPSDATNPARKREKAFSLLHALLRRAPVSFEDFPKRSSGQSRRRPRKSSRRSR